MHNETRTPNTPPHKKGGNNKQRIINNRTTALERSAEATTVLPAKNESDVAFCLQVLSKTLTWTPHLS